MSELEFSSESEETEDVSLEEEVPEPAPVSFDEELSKTQQFIAKVKNVASSPKVFSGLRFANAGIDLAGRIATAKLTGPTSIAALAIGVTEQVLRIAGIEERIPTKTTPASEAGTKAIKSLTRRGFAPRLVSLDCREGVQVLDDEDLIMEWLLPKCEALTDESAADVFYRIKPEFVDGGEAYIYKAAAGGNTRFLFPSYESKEAKALRRQSFSLLGGPVLTAQSGDKAYATGRSFPDQKVLGKNSVEQFAVEVKRYHDAGLSRAVLLYGPPGSGKTSFATQYAKYISRPILIIPPEALSAHSRLYYLYQIEPGVILFDDVDRCGNNVVNSILTMVDTIRSTYRDTLVVATINDVNKIPRALQRPGRFGQRLRFDAPQVEDSILIFESYLRDCNPAAYAERRFDTLALVKEMQHVEFTADYVKSVAEQSLVVDSQEELITFVRELREDLENNESEI